MLPAAGAAVQRRGAWPVTSGMIAYIVTGHGWKSPGNYDPGTVHNGLEEAKSVRRLAEVLRPALAARGVQVVVDDVGHYSERHARAMALLRKQAPTTPMVVIHLHHNASSNTSARKALAMYDRRSSLGASLAAALAGPMALSAFGRECELVPVYDDQPTAGDRAWLYNAFSCIDEVFAGPATVCACLLECGFLSHAPTATWFTSSAGYALTAEAIALGASAWLTRRAAALKAVKR